LRKGSLGAPRRGPPRHLPDHEPRDLDPAGLGILPVHAVVALVRVGHRDDLAGVGRVGQHLLVAAHRGVEDGLAERLAGRAERAATERRAVLQDEQRFGPARHRWAFPSWTTSSPRNTVWITFPRSVRPRKA